MKEMKYRLFNARLKLASTRKSEPWEMKNLEAAIKGLKKGKARDPNGWANELFKDEVAGKDLKRSLLMKEENEGRK